MTTTLVILAGGASSRMKRSLASNTNSLTKEEVEQANKMSKGLIALGKNKLPLLDYVLFNAKQAGFTKIVFLTGPDNAAFLEHYGQKGNYHGLETYFAVQHIPGDREKPLGTADALLQTIDQQSWLKTSKFVVCNSDNLYSVKAFSLLAQSQAPNAFISYDRDRLLFSQERINRFALVKVDDQQWLVDIIEKPNPELVESYADANGKFRVSMNIFMFSGAVIYPYLQRCELHPERLEKELPTALLNMVREQPYSVVGLPLAEHVPDLTSKEDISILKAHLESHFPAPLWKGD